jgi:hypothetical protein
MRDRWLCEIRSRAASFWSKARRRHLLGDKHLLLDPVRDAPMLRIMGLVQRDGSMSAPALRKLMQTNQLVALLQPLFFDLAARHPVVRILDAGAGRSYLTLLVGWCFRHLWQHPVQVLGVDRQEVLVAKSRRRAAMALVDDTVRFVTGAIDGLDLENAWRVAFGETAEAPPVHAVLSLHACDTATDDALALGVRSGASLIAVVPCCQAELAARWAELAEHDVPSPLKPVFQSPHLRREAGATLTDALRVLLLRSTGYRVTAMECVPSAHTPKNTLIRAVRGSAPAEAAVARTEYVALRAACGDVDLALERALSGWCVASGHGAVADSA